MSDPNAVTSLDWNNLHIWLTVFWIYFPVVIIFAFTILTAHAFIPSAVNTGHLPPSFIRLRLPLTIFAVLVLAVAVVLMVFVMILTKVSLANIYERFLI
ncbi:MAG: hypothetical protein ACE5Q6_04660 [Dehalococcoidia bacterium]